MTVLRRYVEPPPEQRTGMPKGTWHARECYEGWKGPHFVGSDGKRYDITLCCPQCGNQCMITSQYHTIASDGTVSPSIVCCNASHGCSWHVFAKLEGWPP